VKKEKWLVLPDFQWPYHDEQTVNAVFKYASEQRWDGILQLGDFMDWDWCSKWTAENRLRQENQRFALEYEGANKFLDKLVKVVRNRNPLAQIVILEGNHDWRPEHVIEKQPSLKGMIEMEKNLRFKERGIYYHRYWTHRKPYQIGNALFVHGEYTNDAHAKKMAHAFDKPCFYGHTHDVQRYTRVVRGSDRTLIGQSLGCLCRYDLPYMGHKPSNWSQAFAVFYFQPNGYFNYYVTEIFNHSFTAPEGKEYK
jgi:predicted phosphodiesterase